MAAELLDCPAEHLLRFLAIQFDRRFARFKLVHQVTFNCFHVFHQPSMGRRSDMALRPQTP
jgi:hypothetical protein